MNWYLDVVKHKYAQFDGRARRQEYWMFFLINLGIAIAIAIVEGLIGVTMGIIGLLYALAVLVPSIAAGVRRLHDTDRSGWWMLLGFVPLIGLALIVLLALEGTQGPNQYGPDPKGGVA